MANRLVQIGLGLVVVCLLGGCAGYQFGNRSLYRPDVRTVHVPIFQSDSFRQHLGERLQEAVVKQIELKTPYKVVGSLGADTVLQGRITTDTKNVIVENRFDDPRGLDLEMSVQVAWIDHRGQPVQAMQNVAVPAELIDSSAKIGYVPEVGQTLVSQQQILIDRLAEQIVASMERPW